MAVTWPRDTAHPLNEPDFVGLINEIEEALNQAYIGTGWRDISASLANGWTATFLRLRRVGTTAQLIGIVSGASATASPWITLGSSFGLDAGSGSFMPLFATVGTVPGPDTVRITSGGQLSSGLRVADIRVVAQWPVGTTWPASLPGVAIP